MKRLMFLMRETTAYAYLCGLVECLLHGNESGRTHATNADWNYAYDIGMTHADWLARRKS